MLSSSYLTAKLIQLRRELTGESKWFLARWARGLEQDLPQVDRTTLVNALRDPGPAPDRVPTNSVVPAHLRRRVLPAALHRAQWDLEAAVLQAIERGMEHLRFHETAWSRGLDEVVEAVRPMPDSLHLRLVPHILGPMLGELLPIDNGPPEELSGTAGSRVRWREPGAVEIVLLDSFPQARVLVTTVPAHVWRAAQTYIRHERPDALRLGATHPETLSPGEVERCRLGPRLYLPTHLASGLLRRIKVFRDAWSIGVSGRGIDSLMVEWQGSPSPTDVLAMLCHPATQIATDRFIASVWEGSGHADIRDLDAPVQQFGSRTTPSGELVLRKLELPRSRSMSRGAGKMLAIWHAWEADHRGRVRRSPEPTSSHLDGMVALRCRYTGEDPVTARRCLASLPEGADLQQLRTGVVPDAHSVNQRILETSMLLAIRDCDPPKPAGLPWRHQVIRAVSPRKSGLVVQLEGWVVPWFLQALLSPVDSNDASYGVPGLRVVVNREELQIRLLDQLGAPTDALVTVKGVSGAKWDGIWEEIRNAEHGPLIDPRLDRSPQLSAGERHGMVLQRRRCGPVAMGSALLRRWGLLADAFALDAWSGLGNKELHVEIDNGPSMLSIVEELRHPVAGIVRDAVAVNQIDATFARLSDHNPTPDRYVGHPLEHGEHPALVLRALNTAVSRRNRNPGAGFTPNVVPS
ncbi:hypothetical protein SUDANB95_02225 [Actinosynnema sp. ALI-1.44]